MTPATSARIALLAAALGTATAHAQEFPLTEAGRLVGRDATIEAVEVLGRKAVRLTTRAEAEDCLALVPGVDFQDGTIDVDIALKVTTPPGVRMPGFIGVAYRGPSFHL